MPEKLIVRCAIMIVVLAPIWRRLYIGGFWARVRGTVIQMDLQYNNSRMPGSIWVPTIEYDAAGQRWRLAKNYWQYPGAKPAYKVGDQVELLCHPRKPWRFTYKDKWLGWIIAAAVTWQVGLYVNAHLPPDV
jgi:hypothetical protein